MNWVGTGFSKIFLYAHAASSTDKLQTHARGACGSSGQGAGASGNRGEVQGTSEN